MAVVDIRSRWAGIRDYVSLVRRRHNLPDPNWSIPSVEGTQFRLESVETEVASAKTEQRRPEGGRQG